MKNERLNRRTNQHVTPAQSLAPRSSAAQPQLELDLSGGLCRSRTPRQRRLSRANWWFQRMRQLVDRACDWQPAPAPRPEQTWLSIAHRAEMPNSNSDITVVTT